MQLEIEDFTSDVEYPAYLSEQLITYLGNKRSLIGSIEKVVQKVSKNLGKERLSTCDVFSGSGVVSRMLKKYSHEIHANDFESYAALVSRAYLTNKNEIDVCSFFVSPVSPLQWMMHFLNELITSDICKDDWQNLI